MAVLPSKSKRVLIQARIDAALVKEIRAEAKRRGVSIQSIIQFGLETFLEASRKETK
jgi:hypothetical protein